MRLLKSAIIIIFIVLILYFDAIILDPAERSPFFIIETISPHRMRITVTGNIWDMN